MSAVPTGESSSFCLGLICGCTAGFSLSAGLLIYLQCRTNRSIDDTEKDGVDDASSSNDFLKAGNNMMRLIVKYREDLVNSLPVISKVSPNYLVRELPGAAPVKGQSWAPIFDDINRLIIPGLTNWESNSKFFAYFKPHSSYPAVLGELLCAGLNVMGFDWIASPACTELEVVVLDWLAKFLNLPEKFLNLSSSSPGGSVIQGSAGEAAIVAFLAAITKKKSDRSGKSRVSRDDMVVFSSDQAHAIVQKACMVLGIGHHHVIKTRKEDDFSMQASSLRTAIEEETARGRTPVCAVATTGTTSSCAFDPVDQIADVCTEFGVWLHIDAAYGGAYACIPELQPLFAGLHKVDSFVVNCHKKLLCPFDLSALYVADRGPLLQALSLQPEYLRNAASDSGAVVDYEHWQLPLGRRFRALKLWFVLRRYGTDSIRRHLEKGLELSSYFASLLATEPDMFELAAPVSLSLVCFRLKGRSEDEQKRFLDAVKATGDCFIIHTKLAGKIVIRFACGGMEQSTGDILRAWKVILKTAKSIYK